MSPWVAPDSRDKAPDEDGEATGPGDGDSGPDLGASILPYGYVVGQQELRTALELCYIEPRIGGVLVHGPRGTAKSTIVRSFTFMARTELPVTLPINATDDRIIGGLNIEKLLGGVREEQFGLLKEAHETGLLYIDEVNLLDDHVVNLILDTVSTGILDIQRDGIARKEKVSFALVATMNPEEGGLRPQLLDRFGLMVPIAADNDPAVRAEILRTVLRFEAEAELPESRWLAEGRQRDETTRQNLESAHLRYALTSCPPAITDLCADVASAFEAVGHRAELVMARGARARAALDNRSASNAEDVRHIAPLALVHRRKPGDLDGESSWAHDGGWSWRDEDEEKLDSVINGTWSSRR
jgi:magnesium chelatase subunit I